MRYRELQKGDTAKVGERIEIPGNALMSFRGTLTNINPEERSFNLDSSLCSLDIFKNIKIKRNGGMEESHQ